MSDWLNKCHFGDVRDVLQRMAADGVKVQTIVTSPPYWGLRSYLPANHPDKSREIGSEPTLGEFLKTMVGVFDLCREVLADDGTMWVNMGDSYTSGGRSTWRSGASENKGHDVQDDLPRPATPQGLKAKDLMGQPWRLALALQDAGWYLRQDIIWCLSGGAWVYARTQKGDMPVMVKDLVRLDPATVQLWNGQKWTRVLGWGPSNDESERLELVLRSGERIGCTGGHQWPTQRGNVTARELRVGDTISTCRLPEPEGCERPAYLTNDALWLVGLYLAEGSRSGNSRARQLALSADEQHWIPRIEAIAKHYGGSCGYTVNGGSLSVRLYGAVLHSIIDAYIGGSVAIDKHLKVAAWRLPNEALSALVQGYLDGDGHDDAGNGRWRLGFCRNYSLERDLRTLAARLGATLTLKPGSAAYQNGEAPVFRGEWRWERSGHWNEKDRGEVMEIRASRARGFWDIAVEDEPHLFALASGVLTHNCKPNPMPESTRDRCTKAHEYIFLLSKSERYYFDQAAIRTPLSVETKAQSFDTMDFKARDKYKMPDGWNTGSGAHGSFHPEGREKGKPAHGSIEARKARAAANHKSAPTAERNGIRSARDSFKREDSKRAAVIPGQSVGTHRPDREESAYPLDSANKRSVWTVASEPYKGSHFATFPRKLIEPCILAGAPAGGVVLDIFLGSGTTAQVAEQLGRQWIGIDIDQRNAVLQAERLRQPSLALEAA